MTPETFLQRVLDPGLAFLESLGGPRPTNDARRFLLCIAMQESGAKLEARYQNSPSSSPGPARSWWQMEQGGGVAGVLNHRASQALARQACGDLSVVAEPAAVWRVIEGHDLLATVFARLLVFTDPASVPVNQTDAWNYYLRVWRPGKPHPETWPNNWAAADHAVAEET